MQRRQNDTENCFVKLHQKDSIISDLIQKNESLNAKVARVDSLIVRVMNVRLQSKYIEKNVNDAISDYNSISNPQLKEKYKYRETLLRLYEGYYNEIVSFVKRIQNDKMRINKFQFEEYKEKCKRGMMELSYYGRYSGEDKKQNIDYLKKVLNRVEKELEKHGKPDPVTGREYFSDFQFLLDEFAD